jgi:hypothetical protein
MPAQRRRPPMEDGAGPELNKANAAEVERLLYGDDRWFESLNGFLTRKYPDAAAVVPDAIAGGVESYLRRDSKLPPIEKPRVYLTKAAQNRVLSSLRRARRFEPLDAADDEEDDVVSRRRRQRILEASDRVEDQVAEDDFFKFLAAHVSKWENANIRTVTMIVLDAALAREPVSIEQIAELARGILGHEVSQTSISRWKSADSSVLSPSWTNTTPAIQALTDEPDDHLGGTMTTESAQNVDIDARGLLEEAILLSSDLGPEVEEEVRRAGLRPLGTVQATNLYTKILTVLRSCGRGRLSDAEQQRIATEVRNEVEGLVASVPRPTGEGEAPELELIEKNGLKPHPVMPIPNFNGVNIPMEEGYVDVNTLPLWSHNHRIQLVVEEFRERNGRDPDEDDLLKIVQGKVDLPSLDKKDPFRILPLARSIARKGVERPPIVTHDGEPKDGNRRIAAALLVQTSDEFNIEEKERARWVRVWKAPPGTTEDQFEAIVVALNFEESLQIEWPEYIKGRLVVERYNTLCELQRGRLSEARNREIKKQVAQQYAITLAEVTRYIRMVQWAEDFEQYLVEEKEEDPARVRYRTDKVFQWFYEIQAGRGDDKLTAQLDKDDELRRIVYDLMYDVLDSGAQVRNLHKVVQDEEALKLLERAHDAAQTDKAQALGLVEEAIHEASRRAPTKRLALALWVRGVIERLGATPPDEWRKVDDLELLGEFRRVVHGALGAVDGILAATGGSPQNEE